DTQVTGENGEAAPADGRHPFHGAATIVLVFIVVLIVVVFQVLAAKAALGGIDFDLFATERAGSSGLGHERVPQRGDTTVVFATTGAVPRRRRFGQVASGSRLFTSIHRLSYEGKRFDEMENCDSHRVALFLRKHGPFAVLDDTIRVRDNFLGGRSACTTIPEVLC